jgi:hypothetical protein
MLLGATSPNAPRATPLPRGTPLVVRTLVFILLLIGATAPVGEADAAVRCHRHASTSGHDTNTGSRQHPFRTVRHLVRSLRPGQTGCLMGGTFREDVTIYRGGRRGDPITLRSMPGNRATLRGRLVVDDSANYVVVRNLRLDGRNSRGLASPFVSGDFVRFVRNNITNYHEGICFIVGSHTWGVARRTVIRRNRIHDCGRLPPTNHDHGIYVEASRGARIVHNYIYDNADRGIQLYPDARHTRILHNVIDGNGSGIIFSGVNQFASSDNYVARNIISYSRVRYNVESWWPDLVGTANLVARNCVWRGNLGNFDRNGGYRLRDNVIANPRYRDRARNDFRLRSGSACRRMGPR